MKKKKKPVTPLSHLAKVLPLAISLAPAVLPSAASKAPSAPTHAAAAAKQFSIPVSNLRDWSGTVIVSINGVKIEGHSPVHPVDSDCEMHLGAHTPNFNGSPNGLVLEPMNACVQPFPDKQAQSNAD